MHHSCIGAESDELLSRVSGINYREHSRAAELQRFDDVLYKLLVERPSTATSGCSSAVSDTASWPVVASPQTSQAVRASIRLQRPNRTMLWSSARRIWTIADHALPGAELRRS